MNQKRTFGRCLVNGRTLPLSLRNAEPVPFPFSQLALSFTFALGAVSISMSQDDGCLYRIRIDTVDWSVARRACHVSND